jgi:4-diphosphocytidyl-2-C-methyl-D-erythritol kinase
MIVEQVGQRVIVQTPAKLNLFLEVLGKRDDGYHEIESLVVPIDLFDVLTFEDDGLGCLSLICDDPTLPTDLDNLVLRAASRLRDLLGTKQTARITLAKHIPAQAGLGGGSSDAAATLVGLCRLWNQSPGASALERLAAELGSDVPFFLQNSAAFCRGRGERIEPIEHQSTFYFVLVSPPIGVRTPDVYSRVTIPVTPSSANLCLEGLIKSDTNLLGAGLFNRLQAVAEALAPDLLKVSGALNSLNPSLDGHLMTGSGSTYFGLCRDKQAALAATRHLETLGQGRVRVVKCGP